MDQDTKQQIALAKYALIAPLLNGTAKAESIQTFCEEASKIPVTLPGGKTRYYAPATINRWYWLYNCRGFEGLMPQGRKDEGCSRVMDEELAQAVRYMKQTYPKMPVTMIRQRLIDNGTMDRNGPSLSTMTRYVNRWLEEEKINATGRDMHRYERPHINEVWCGDTTWGPVLKEGGVKRRVYCIALLDDASRFILCARFFYNDNFLNMMQVMRSAVMRFGVPKMWNFDNGKSYRNHQMELLAARICSVVHYDRPYTPQQKAKLERWFLTMKEQWMSGLNMKDFSGLEELNRSLQTYVDTYNRTVHASLSGKTPEERFFSEPDRIRRLTAEQIERSFLLEIERKVSIDNVISIENVAYEVPSRLSRQRIRLRYAPDMSQIYIVENDGSLTQVRLLNKTENAVLKREKFRYSAGEE